MRIVIRVDASLAIATGHVIRCLTLASALRKRGATVSFVCREHPGHLNNFIEERGFPVIRLPAPRTDSCAVGTFTHTDWLGISWTEDAAQTQAAISSLEVKPDWLILDHYALDHRWENALRASVGRIMVVDDLADRVHDCDMLLDQNLVAKMNARYNNKVPEECALLLGPRYALVQSIFSELQSRVPTDIGPVRRIFICFGGLDNDNLTGRALSAFISLNRPDIEVDMVISSSSSHAETLRRKTKEHRNIHLHTSLLSLAPLMFKADIAIGACGTTSWERLCLGLRSIVVTTSENQRPTAEELNRKDLIRWLGHKDEVDEATLARELNAMIQGLSPRRCSEPLDGKGAQYVSTALTITASSPLNVRPVKPSDEDILLEWANDLTTRRNSLAPDPIDIKTHHKWFTPYLSRSKDRRLCIIETTDRVALGQVRFTRHQKDWEVHYSIGPAYRGRGLGRPLLEAALMSLIQDFPRITIFGRVKNNNLRSCHIFESLGFEIRSPSQTGTRIYQRTFCNRTSGMCSEGDT